MFFFVVFIPSLGRIPICDYNFSDGLTPPIRWKQGVLMEMVLSVDGGTKFSLQFLQVLQDGLFFSIVLSWNRYLPVCGFTINKMITLPHESSTS